ncbi:xylulokinase [Luteococcus peritonei]|uniref:Xylulose kinase n=1 Tax=Luteococcus peritonei TaxID=88874 RepID=A0ABW4RVU1_9ACTN
MALVLGIDSSTQSTKALLVDADSGEVVAQGRAPHPDGTSVDPRAWLAAVDQATEGLLERAEAVAVGGQQHGMVALDEHDVPVREALLWNDTRSAAAAEELNQELGGPAEAARLTGSVLVASITAAKARWMATHEPENARRTARIVLPHDYVGHHLAAPGSAWTTDRGDASGTGWYSPAENRLLPQVAALALGHEIELTPIAEQPQQVVAHTTGGAAMAAGTGDNMAAALGLAMLPGDVSVSIGTSGVAAMVSEVPTADATGAVNGFADATGRFLPLACTLNAARIMDLGARMLGISHAELDQLALQAPPGANGVVLLPYLDGERTPNRPEATGVVRGIRSSTGREDIARACIEGLACSLADAVAALRAATGSLGTEPGRILLIGGGARSEAARRVLPAVLGHDLLCPQPAEYVALGAAAQAAWALSGATEPPRWPAAGTVTLQAEPTPQVLERYRELRDLTAQWCRPSGVDPVVRAQW